MDIYRSTALRFLEYHAWATQKTLDSLEPLSLEELNRDMRTSHSSIWGALDHVYRGDSFWFHRHQGPPQEDPNETEAAASLSDLRAKWSALHTRWISYAGSLQGADWTRVFEYRFVSGFGGAVSVYENLIHVVNHGTAHRGQVTAMVRQLGAQPAWTDFLTYVHFAP
jgi:uncharacterized damage-inducible protein DinB